MLFGIIRVDIDGMRALDHRIPLRPAFGDGPPCASATTILSSQRASTPIRPFQFFSASSASCPGAPPPGSAATGPCDALRKGTWAVGNERLGPSCGTGVCGGRRTTGSSPRLHDDHAVGALGEHALDGAPAPIFVARQLRHGLGPIAHHVVRPCEIPTAFTARNRGEALARPALAVYGLKPCRQQSARDEDNEGGRENCQFSLHACLPYCC
jgi:hypothetical protein